MPVVDRKSTQQAAERRSKSGEQSQGFTDAERAAMKACVQEQKAEARRSADRASGETAAREAIAAMAEPDRAMAERLHAIITANAPALAPKTWYGMPAYAREGKVVCFFKSAQKFSTRYATLGFNDTAHLDEGVMWPVEFALKELTADTEGRIAALVKRAMS